MAEEGLQRTANDLIHIAEPLKIDTVQFIQQLSQMFEASMANSTNIVDMIANAVPTFKPEEK